MRPSAVPGAATKYIILLFLSWPLLRSVSIQAITKRVKCKINMIEVKAIKASIIPKYLLAAPCEVKGPYSQLELWQSPPIP